MHYSHGGAFCIFFDVRIYPPSFPHYILVRPTGTAVSLAAYTLVFGCGIAAIHFAHTSPAFYTCIISILLSIIGVLGGISERAISWAVIYIYHCFPVWGMDMLQAGRA